MLCNIEQILNQSWPFHQVSPNRMQSPGKRAYRTSRYWEQIGATIIWRGEFAGIREALLDLGHNPKCGLNMVVRSFLPLCWHF